MRNTQSIENFERDVYDGLKDYFDVLASGSTQSLAEFVDNQTNSELYEQNLEQYGTPYFLYEQRKAYLNALIETIAEEQNVSFDSLRPYIDVLIDFFLSV